MSNERYNQIIDEAYENYKHYFENKYGNYITGRITKEDGDYLIVNKHPLPQETILSIIYSKEEFINKCKINSEFSEKWGLKIEERELTLEERYNKWFNNNYETGMERYFDPNDLPDFNDPYYEPTPTKIITVTYQGEKIEVYE